MNENNWQIVEKARFDNEMEAEQYMINNYLENGFYKLDAATLKFVVYNEEEAL